MAVVLYDEDAVQVLKSFRPYLGPQGEKVADLLDEFLKLLSSEPAQNYIITLQNSLNGDSRRFFGDGEKKKANPFTLFLILILLLLSDFAGSPDGKGRKV
ncbi:hypothetical protein [Syntrophaceticus schinkii]|jgi:hypothetical protein|uniref:Uncharacterized protein n=1 Tax=Syntrophaceticus schinkii TaxID=499207 RepID=A0A0B7MH79_9FIRM|nr:hypothetical protein [Syntrophaceticus schinkii]MDD2359632.1 hypothetical protein [Syntrophaceticus schinkii]MDD4261229.1 hypothetical protein [Syntrophaceticus schinkii]MDD4674408.1 hypothetical protein [Syntrophaceticus schinkii]CEO87291.1 hypothetical protein SSCH_10025 [Syntrophaceticus schinkii]